MIDEVGIYNHALTLTDIAALYNSPLTNLLMGDANRDGVVSADDYTSVAINLGDSGDRGILGDANGDGFVDSGDFLSIQENYGFGGTALMAPPEATPEPATLSLLMVGGLVLIRRVRSN